MKLLRKLSALLCLLALLLPFASCGTKQKAEGVSVVCTLFPQYDFARTILGERGTVHLLIPPGMDAHSYEPTLSDLAAVRRADLFIRVGGETDAWSQKISPDGSASVSFALLDVCPPLTEELTEGMEEPEEEEEDCRVEYDEHVWTSPKNAQKIAARILKELCELDPEGTEYFQKNFDSFSAELDRLDADFRSVVAEAEHDTIVFAERFPFRYLCDEYQIRYFAAFPGCSSQSEPSLATLSFLMNKIKEKHLPAVLKIEFSTGEIAARIADACGVRVLAMHSCHNLTAEEFNAGETYLTLMRKNLEVLREALNG